jgi:hypothetical protein
MRDSNASGEILSCCGFRCDICPAYEKNVGGPADLEKIRRDWKKYFGFDIPEDRIACVGCANEGRHADADCPVRPCAVERRIKTCADCPDFECDKLKSRMDFAETAMEKSRIIPEGDFRSYFLPYLSWERIECIRREKNRTRI